MVSAHADPDSRPSTMRLAIWNVNGLRACTQKGFLAWLRRTQPDLVGLQETRLRPEELPAPLRRLRAWRSAWFPARRSGYSGVGLLYRVPPVRLVSGLGLPRFDEEGRTQIAEFADFAFINSYFPNGKGPSRDNGRVPFKLDYYAAILDRALALRASGRPVIIGGDFNTAHREIDLRNWRENRGTSGFLDEERAWIDRFLGHGFHDVHREHHAEEEGHYTWWSQRGGARERNVGWRIDYFLVDRALLPRIRRTWIEARVPGSDHCPVGMDLDLPGARAGALGFAHPA
jgi:exodeoxyribonuclease-3